MNVIAFLNEHSIEELERKGITCKHVADKNVYILNYQQLLENKNKYDPIARECRSLVVRRKTDGRWYVMARSFSRFFNYGENKEETKLVEDNIAECIIQEKKDGSLITVTYFDDAWHIFTRGSDADTNPFRGMKLDKDEKETFGSKVRKYIQFPHLNQRHTYVFELCVPGSHITQYQQEHLSLLTIWHSVYYVELDNDAVDDDPTVKHHVQQHLWNRPECFRVATMDELFTKMNAQRFDFEGYVVRYGHMRVKCKKDSYKRLHLLGSSVMTTENMVRCILKGESDELKTISCLSSCAALMDHAIKTIHELVAELEQIWIQHKHLDTKSFAMEVIKKKHCLTLLLFLIHRGRVQPTFNTLFLHLDDQTLTKCVKSIGVKVDESLK